MSKKVEKFEVILSKFEDRPVVSSRVIAEQLGKKHFNVLRDIENILKSHPPNLSFDIEKHQTSNLSFDPFFIESSYTSGTGKQYKEYLLTKDGFTLYMFNIQGYQEFKLAYINEFNRMEAFIQQSGLEEHFKNFRITGKTVRRDLARTIQNEIKPDCSFVYSNYTNLIYKALFGKSAKQLKEERGITKSDNLRDNLTEEELNKLSELEDRVRAFIITFKAMGIDEKEIYRKVKEVI